MYPETNPPVFELKRAKHMRIKTRWKEMDHFYRKRSRKLHKRRREGKGGKVYMGSGLGLGDMNLTVGGVAP